MGDLRNSALLYLKGALFLLLGILASALLLLDRPTWKAAFLLAVAIWAFARAYYFAFYVIEHYIDGGERYAGIIHFIRRHMTRRRTPGSG